MMSLNIGVRLAVGSAMPVLAIVLLTFGAWVAFERLGATQDQGAARAENALAAESAAGLGAGLYQVIADAVINRDFKETRTHWAGIRREAEDLFSRMDGMVRTPEQRSANAAAREAYNSLIQTFESEMLPLLQASDQMTPAIRQMDGRVDALVETMTENYEKIRKVFREEVKESDRVFDETRQKFERYGGIIAVITLFGILVSTFFINRSITLPLLAITAATRRLAGGDFQVAIPAQDRQDELGGLAGTIQVFKDNAQEMERMRADQARQQQQAEEEKLRSMGRLADGFETTVQKIVTSVGSSSSAMEQNARALAETAAQTSEQSRSVAVAADHASSNVQTVASAAEELAASVNEISRQVTESTRIATTAAEEARRTNATVSSLSEAAQKIGDVVGLINSIASQTNLLALNATIEAARAGEAGKGFAVVASEVKNLANQTAKATEDIQAQVSQMQAATGEAVQAIQGISGTIGRINDIAATIAAAVEEQGATTREIARNVQQAAQGTQEVSRTIGDVTEAAARTGGMAGQTLQSAREVSQQASAMSSEVDSFIRQIRKS
jgi:methyl-accepting chemotaxis protein